MREDLRSVLANLNLGAAQECHTVSNINASWQGMDGFEVSDTSEPVSANLPAGDHVQVR